MILKATCFKAKKEGSKAFFFVDQTGVEPVSENEFPFLLLS